MIHIKTKFERPSGELTERFSKLGSATVHEASGRKGAVDPAIKPIRRGLRLCGQPSPFNAPLETT
jgi:4-hydroxy-4-methyl-2-oxoglutarate aldolase